MDEPWPDACMAHYRQHSKAPQSGVPQVDVRELAKRFGSTDRPPKD